MQDQLQDLAATLKETNLELKILRKEFNDYKIKEQEYKLAKAEEDKKAVKTGLIFLGSLLLSVLTYIAINFLHWK